MISIHCIKSYLVLTSVLFWAVVGQHSIATASPLKSESLNSGLLNTPVESKSGAQMSSPEILVVEDETQYPVENFNKLLQSQPQLRLLRPNWMDGREGPVYRNENEVDYVYPPQYRSLVKFGKRAAAMGVDLPDYILHINKGRNFDFSSFREKMQKSG